MVCSKLEVENDTQNNVSVGDAGIGNVNCVSNLSNITKDRIKYKIG